ncbi:DUF1803 domain-containing protein [Candidatus Enterococcus ikei]|uniref:DUF1803 domain-containing protein n=1 Tax=Candidatus Enterococcus ikei TaxID=2815326 RepID=A0ABS3H1C9_9ENTE|nr:DUF1803 domain-containing protein [Enterococcus sp. DIV0869a]MBO0441331.1 DUF1803 domain-containing protein [Enterococcus sp. DIV0869a]
MENVTYYFGSTSHQEPLNKLVSDPLLKQLVTYFFERKEQEVMLRQIKTDIPTDSNIELYLDKLIKNNLLERKNRRYTLTFPIYSERTFQITVPNSITTSIHRIIEEDANLSYFIFGEWLWAVLFDEETEDYFFGVDHSLNNSPNFLNKVEVGDSTLHFVSIFRENQMPFDLANYFSLLSKGQAIPKQFEPLQKLIGDVDLNYFIPQVQKLLRSVKRNKSVSKKINIFQEALLLTQDLKKSEEGKLILAVPMIEKDAPSEAIQEILEQLKVELCALWATIENRNQRLFFKKQLYCSLFDDCLTQINSFSYFKR